MKSSMPSSSFLLLTCALLSCCNSNGFVVNSTPRSTMILNAQKDNIGNETDVICDRRKMLFQGFNLALGVGAVVAGNPNSASASYSAYANREKDWEARKKSGGTFRFNIENA